MKFINLLTLLFAALFFAGCASTDDSAPASSADTTESQADAGGLLMDQYKSGAIPGYREEVETAE